MKLLQSMSAPIDVERPPSSMATLWVTIRMIVGLAPKITKHRATAGMTRATRSIAFEVSVALPSPRRIPQKNRLRRPLA
jgi:hypothetical protein